MIDMTEAANQVDAYVNEPTQTGSPEQAVRGAVRLAVRIVANASADGATFTAALREARAASQVAAVATCGRLTDDQIYTAGVQAAAEEAA